jgi:DNA-binding winged helix-turn-helix (wHTH) protein
MAKAAGTGSKTIRIDGAAGTLQRDDQEISLRPKTWAVLQYLAERPGILVPKAELLAAVWPDAVVTDGTLNKSIG